MDRSNSKPSLEEINRMDLTIYLALLGFQPVSINNEIYRYFSPLRKEHLPSFVVSRRTNSWAQGSYLEWYSLMDFAVQYHGFTIAELENHFLEQPLFRKTNPRSLALYQADKKHDIAILDHGTLLSHQLAWFLKERRIPWDIAREDCGQVEYGYAGRVQKAVSFGNDAGGFVVENSFFKGTTGARDKTFIDQGGNICAVFDDFMDFLSYKAIAENGLNPAINYLVLNGLGLNESSLSVLNQQSIVKLFLPFNHAGQEMTNRLTRSSRKFADQSALYKNYGNLNGWIRFIGHKLEAKVDLVPKLRQSG